MVNVVFLVGPAGVIMGETVIELTATCKPNLLKDKLPNWKLEPDTFDLNNVKCVRYLDALKSNIHFDAIMYHRKALLRRWSWWCKYFRSNICNITVGVLPFEAPNIHLVDFDPLQDYFGRPLKSLSTTYIGDKILIYCLYRKTKNAGT